jgi:hemolysin D
LHGHVIEVSPDVVTADRRPTDGGSDETSASSGGTANQAASGSPTYTARVALDGSRMKVDGKMEPLKPGMAVTAEIKTGSRRILQYLLSPLRQYAEDSIKER